VNELHLFAGAGGGILGGILLGHTCVCAVEIEPYCRKVLLQRQRDGMVTMEHLDASDSGEGVSNKQRQLAQEMEERRQQQPGIDANTEAITSDSRLQRIQGKQFKTIRRFTAFPWGEDVRRIEDLQNRPDIPQPLIRRIGNDVAFGVDRLKAIGNGQVPRVVKLAWETLSAICPLTGTKSANASFIPKYFSCAGMKIAKM
jgi:hypothetical protein